MRQIIKDVVIRSIDRLGRLQLCYSRRIVLTVKGSNAGGLVLRQHDCFKLCKKLVINRLGLDGKLRGIDSSKSIRSRILRIVICRVNRFCKVLVGICLLIRCINLRICRCHRFFRSFYLVIQRLKLCSVHCHIR